jgi:hypothetical protein
LEETGYGVPTRRLNEQVKRNARRFPQDFLFRLTVEEMEQCQRLRSHFVTLKRGRSIERSTTDANRSQIATSSPGPILKSQIATSSSTHGGRRKLPYAFTEHGSITGVPTSTMRKGVWQGRGTARREEAQGKMRFHLNSGQTSAVNIRHGRDGDIAVLP